ncbi:MAG: hypothetical protein HYV07_30360 [Deltaproteobacteria bacterium]|nr:hypothetical protein [Deltaproteobacteria bacterium]
MATERVRQVVLGQVLMTSPVYIYTSGEGGAFFYETLERLVGDTEPPDVNESSRVFDSTGRKYNLSVERGGFLRPCRTVAERTEIVDPAQLRGVLVEYLDYLGFVDPLLHPAGDSESLDSLLARILARKPIR